MSSKFQFKAKRVFLDCRHVNTGGIGVYIEELMPRVVSLLPDLQFTVLESSQYPLNLSNKFKNVQSISSAAKMYSLAEQFVFMKLLFMRGYDLAWFPHFTVPFLYSGKILATIHDTFHLSFPSISSSLQRRYFRLAMWRMSSKNNRILTISEFSKREIQKYTSFDDSKIIVAYNGVRRLPIGTGEASLVSGPYILFVGNLKPHKNLKTLVNAFARLSHESELKLVVVGNAANLATQDADISTYLSRLGDRLILLGRVTDVHLRDLYGDATLFVSPSLYEGFGLPPLEAMLNGAPILVSSIGPHEEIFADKVTYFNPTDENELVQKMTDLLQNPSVVSSIDQEALLKRFDWEAAAQKIAKVIEEQIKI